MRAALVLACVIGLTISMPALSGGGGVVLSLSDGIDELELYRSPNDDDPASIVGADGLRFPMEILELSNNGMFRLRHEGADYWVITDDVRSDRTRDIDAACEPKLAGEIVAHGKRGVGEGCE